MSPNIENDDFISNYIYKINNFSMNISFIIPEYEKDKPLDVYIHMRCNRKKSVCYAI